MLKVSTFCSGIGSAEEALKNLGVVGKEFNLQDGSESPSHRLWRGWVVHSLKNIRLSNAVAPICELCAIAFLRSKVTA